MGVIAALLCACTSTAKDLVSKAVASKVHPDTSTFASFVYALPFYAVIFAVLHLAGGEGLRLSQTFLLLVLLRGISDVFAEGCKMRALNAGDVSLVSGLLALSPLILTVGSPFITGDVVRPSEVYGILCIVGGGLVLVRRDRSTGRVVQPVAVLYALGGSFAFALNSALDKLAVGHADPVTSAFSVTVCAALLTCPTLFRAASTKGELVRYSRPFLLRGLFETVFMIAKMAALMTLPAHVVVGLMRVSMIFTVMVGGAWFREEDRLRRTIGTIIMYVGLLFLVL
jgi:drug/metabolite transporter (DMT)-like permease